MLLSERFNKKSDRLVAICRTAQRPPAFAFQVHSLKLALKNQQLAFFVEIALKCFKIAVENIVVAVNKDYITAFRVVEPEISCRRGASVRLFEIDYFVVFCSIFLADASAAVGRSVVYKKQLERRKLLFKQAVKAAC